MVSYIFLCYWMYSFTDIYPSLFPNVAWGAIGIGSVSVIFSEDFSSFNWCRWWRCLREVLLVQLILEVSCLRWLLMFQGMGKFGYRVQWEGMKRLSLRCLAFNTSKINIFIYLIPEIMWSWFIYFLIQTFTKCLLITY